MIVGFDSISGVGLVNLLSFVHSDANLLDKLNRFILVTAIDPYKQEREMGTRYGITLEIREWQGTSDILLKGYTIIDESKKERSLQDRLG